MASHRLYPSNCPRCGAERMIRASRTKNGPPLCVKCSRQECCSVKRRGTGNPNYEGTAHISATRYYYWLRNAARTGRKWSLSIEQLEELYLKQGGKCALTGVSLVVATREKTESKESFAARVISLDRINPAKDYTIDNVQFVSWAANRAKHKMQANAFARLCYLVAHRGQPLPEPQQPHAGPLDD